MLRLNCCLAAALSVGIVCSLAAAQESPQPGPEHEALKKLEGKWDATVKMGDQESKGTATYKMGLGGLWLVSDFEAELLGQKFAGHGLDGYDPVTKKYVSTWCDSMTTLPLVTEGEMDKAGKTLTMKGQMRGQDGQMQESRMVTKYPDADTMLWTLYGPGPDGKEMEMLSITYTRKK